MEVGMLRVIAFSAALTLASVSFGQALVGPPQQGPARFDPDEVKPLLVMIEAQFDGGGTENGAGVIFQRRSRHVYIATANHVVRKGARGATAVRVYFPWVPGESFAGNVTDSSDAQLDLAVLIVDAMVPSPRGRWPVISSRDSDLPKLE